jgi:hypothetical protein
VATLHYLFPDTAPKVLASKGYAFTTDNLMKMCLMKTFLECDIPIVMIGETGCGKTHLVQYFGELANIPVHTLDLHGGITEQDVVSFIQLKAKSKKRPVEVIFLDEINTSQVSHLIKEIICDRTMRGQPLDRSLKIIGACNPDRTLVKLVKEEDKLALFHSSAMRQKDTKGELIYKVNPLPLSILQYGTCLYTLLDAIGNFPVALQLHFVLPQNYYNF